MMLSVRRLAIYVTVLLSIAAGAIDTDEESGNNDCGIPNKKVDVTIVGGGLAGIFAASVLEQNNVSYQLLEATDTWGGRLRSFTSDFENESGENIVLEQGAQFMYGKQRHKWKRNPVWRLLKENNVDVLDYTLDDLNAYRKNGKKYSRSKVMREFGFLSDSIKYCLDYSGEEWFDEFAYPDYYEPGSIPTPDNDAKTLLEKCAYDDFEWESDTPLREALAHFLIEQEFGLPMLESIGRASFPEDTLVVFGTKLFTVIDQKGTSVMIENLLNDKLDSDSILLNAKVTSVSYDESSAALTTAMVGNCERTFESKYVIITAPLKILKGKEPRNLISFTPPLDIASHPIDINKIEKVWIQFSEVFWDTSRQWIVISNEQEDGAGTLFFNYELALPGSKMLLGFMNSAQLAAATDDADETIDDNAIEKYITSLKRLRGWNDNITYTWQATEWKDNPYFSGSWEFWELGRTYEEFHNNIGPRDRLHLAGAGHCQNFWGFTWGAIFSGIWNGQWVVDRISNPSSEPWSIAPYTPCEEAGIIKAEDMKEFYQQYGVLFS